VQCDKCQAWQHQICALFNGRRNHGQAEYTCPNCYIQEVEQGERKPVSQNVILGAKSLPASTLSNHLEQRLFKKLKQERQERARLQGKSYEEVIINFSDKSWAYFPLYIFVLTAGCVLFSTFNHILLIYWREL